MTLFAEPREIVLRPHQERSEEAIRDHMRAGARRILLAAPTAYGKTEVSAHIIKSGQNKGSKVWFIVDRVSLIDQTSERFGSYGIDHGIIQADHLLTDMRKPIQVASAQTIARRTIRDDDLPELVVWDECHAVYRAVVDLVDRVVARGGRARAVGLTATPFTAGMAEQWDAVVNGATVNELLASGFLAPLRIKACVRPDMAGVKIRGGEYEDEAAGERGVTIVGDVVQTWIAETRKAFGRPVKTIVFSPSVKHGAELCRQFAEAGYNFQQLSHLDRDEAERRGKIAEFRRPDSAIHGLVSCAVLTKGFDVPDVLCGISCRPYRKSFSSHIQEMGRVMRTSPGKSFGLWLDHSGNAIAFADDTAWLYEYGVDSLSTASKKDSEVREPNEKVRKERFCAECGTMMAPGSDTCPACGWERPQRGEIQTVEGVVVDFDMSTSAAFEPRKGLRAACLSDPRGVWIAARVYTAANTRKGEDAARKWAAGIWKGIYERWPPRNFDSLPADPSKVTPDQWSLIEREVARFRKTAKRREAA